MTTSRPLSSCSEHGLAYDSAVHSGCVVCRRSERPLPPPPPTRKSRVMLFVALGSLTVFLATAIGLYVLYAQVRAKSVARIESKKKDDALREERQAPVASLAPAPLPKALPLLGPVGKDADGYPTQYVDRPAIRSLLWHRKHAELSAYFERFQDDFEADPRREYWPNDAAATFHSSEPELAASLDEWAKATPESFAPYVARGTYWMGVANARRGGKWAADTSDASFAAMTEAVGRAAADLDRAIALRPKLVAARTVQINVFKLLSDDARVKGAIDQAIASCPTCLRPRVAYMHALEPRWGGSYAEMAAFATSSAAAANPRMRLLAGYVDLDKAIVLARAESYDDALIAIGRACAIGDAWDFLVERASIHERRENHALARADVERAATLRPGLPDILFQRARARAITGQWEPAARDLLAGLRVNPTDDFGRASFDWIVNGLDREGWAHHTAGRKDDAIRVYELLHELAPTNRDMNARRTAAVSGTSGTANAQPSNDDIAALEEAITKTPDDVHAYQRLDYALARQRKFDRVIAIWTEYLGRHPNDGTAYLERGGAYYHLRKAPEAHADMTKACELGMSEGCARAKQLAAAMK